MQNLDFLLRANQHINTLGLYTRSIVGPLPDGKVGISLIPLPGGAQVEYMDGSRDKDYNLQISAKSEDPQECLNALYAIGHSLEQLQDLPSSNNSYDFDRFVVTSMPSLVMQDAQHFFIYQLTVVAKIFIKKGVV